MCPVFGSPTHHSTIINFMHHGFMIFGCFQEHNTNIWCVLYIDTLPLLPHSHVKVGNCSEHQNNRLAHNIAIP